MEAPQGRRILFRIVDAAGILREGYGPDGRHLVKHEGRRELGLEILGWFGPVRPDALPAVLLEELQTQRSTLEVSNGRRDRNNRYSDDAERE
jgi:hypothetical protein